MFIAVTNSKTMQRMMINSHQIIFFQKSEALAETTDIYLTVAAESCLLKVVESFEQVTSLIEASNNKEKSNGV